MSCCGKKRESLNMINARTITKTHPNFIRTNSARTRHADFIPSDAVFRYTGTNSLVIRGFSNQRLYHFTVGNPELSVFAEDVAVVRAYPELVEIKK